MRPVTLGPWAAKGVMATLVPMARAAMAGPATAAGQKASFIWPRWPRIGTDPFSWPPGAGWPPTAGGHTRQMEGGGGKGRRNRISLFFQKQI